jgi:hypothetical protein
VWDRLNRPLDDVQATRALLGFDEASARHVLARLLLASDEAREVLESTAHVIRVLRNEQGTLVRSEPSIRGPVLWTETVSLRAASGFQNDLYVCAMPVRNYDIAENRALAAALGELRRAGRLLDGVKAGPPDAHQELLRGRARRAAQLGSHPRLHGVPTRRPQSRDLTRIRNGQARGLYGAAVALLERVAEGPRLEDLSPFVDRANAAHHELLRTVVGEVERSGRAVAPFRTWRGQLYSGHIRYLPPRERSGGAVSGVVLDDVVLTLSERSEPAAGHRRVVVRQPADVRRHLQPGYDLAPTG